MDSTQPLGQKAIGEDVGGSSRKRQKAKSRQDQRQQNGSLSRTSGTLDLIQEAGE